MTFLDAPLALRHCAGYRVLRSLALDDDAQVLLGFRDVDGDRMTTTVALKVHPATAELWRRTVGVVEALERAGGEHVVQLLDLDADGEFIHLVFERLTHGSLAELLTLRESLDAGEVVTIVAPLVEAVMRMHCAGAAHGALTARRVMFREDGAPVLIGFGSSTVFTPGAPEVVLERQAGVGADRRAVRELASRLLGRVGGSRARAARALADALEACPEDALLDMLMSRLFELAAAAPVRFVPDGTVAVSANSRMVAIGAPIVEVPALPNAWKQRVLDAVDASPAAPVATVVARVWRGWSPRRRRVVLGVGAGAIAWAVLVAVAPAPIVRSATAAPTPSPSTFAPRVSAPPTPAGIDPLVADDPRGAAIALVMARERCLRSLSVLCLDGVEQQDSGALRDDRELIRAAQRGGELSDPLVSDPSTLDPELVERRGASALVRLRPAGSASGSPTPQRDPASLLLVKGEAGWRIRDVIDPASRVD